MKQGLTAAVIAVTLAACGGADDPAHDAATEPSPPRSASPPLSDCRSETFEGVGMTRCVADPRRHRITAVLGPKGGAPYRSLAGLAAAKNRAPVAFAMNGGMFDEAGRPIGYYVENGERLHKLNRAKGGGNFHLLPNGVFYGGGGTWAVSTAEKFAKDVVKRPEFGTQSGPMLVIDGKLHPKIAEDGESRYVRNGVGVDRQGRAHFVISDAPVSFGKFARYFRDEAETPNALYLDGNVSALWDPVVGRVDGGPLLGPLIVVEKLTPDSQASKPTSMATASAHVRPARSD